MNKLKKIMRIFILLASVTLISMCSSNDSNAKNLIYPTISITSIPVIEGNDVLFTLSLSKPSEENTTINITTTPDTAQLADYISINTTVTIIAGQTAATVSVKTNDDSLVETTETFLLTALVTSKNTTNSTPIVVKGTLLDNGKSTSDVELWITKGDQSVLLQKQNETNLFSTSVNSYKNIEIDENQVFQTIDGFGFTLTGGSAEVINGLTAAKKQELLQELFGTNSNSIAINYLRISIGASDLNSTVFSYNDLANGQVDLSQANFNLAPDMANLIPLLKEIVSINPNIKIMAVPWSAPSWMKTNYTTIGSSLSPIYYNSYAQYFVKYIQAMYALGITIDAVCPQNEPLNSGNNPSMLMSAAQQTSFIKKLGPAFKSAGINTKIVIYDHNCDLPSYPIEVLGDATANSYIDGSAFHLYGGDISALTTVHNAYPNKKIYFTEQWTSSLSDFGGDLKWHLKNVVIGSMRNWSVNTLEWNLANNSAFGPHTDGGCTQCKGAITINNSSSYTRNVSFYIIGHASKFVPIGSVRIASTTVGNLYNVAFKTPSGKKILIVENDGNSNEIFNIKFNGKWVTTSLGAGSVGTYIW